MSAESWMAMAEAVKAANPREVRRLLAAGIDPAETCGGQTFLHIPAKAEIVEILLAAGTPPDRPDDAGKRPIHVAALNPGAGLENLLDVGADPNGADPNGKTPLHLAVNTDDPGRNIRALIAAGADPNAVDAKGRTPAEAAAGSGMNAAFNVFLAVSAVSPAAAAEKLYAAVCLGRPRAVKAALAAGAAVDHPRTAVRYLAHKAAAKNSPAVLDILINAGWQINEMNGHYWTPLHSAADSGAVSAAAWLLANGADPAARACPNPDALAIARLAQQKKKRGAGEVAEMITAAIRRLRP